MSRSSIAVLFSLAQLFTAANALANGVCTAEKLRPDGTCNGPEPEPPPAPDLVPKITSVSFNGGKVTVAMSISNQGTAAAGPTNTRIQLFKGNATSASHTENVTSNGMPASGALSLSAEAPMPAGLNFKITRVCVTADAQAQVQENDEGNNTVCKDPFIRPIPGVTQP